jgi:hypothetical protein
VHELLDPQAMLRFAVGGLTRKDLRKRLHSHGILLNAHAETLIAHQVFDRRDPQEIIVVDCAVGDLQLPAGGTLPEVYAAARACGLSLCPPDTGPYLRLAMMRQENAPDSVMSAGRSPAGALKVAAARLSDDLEFPTGFYLRVVDHRHWLRGYRCDDEYRFSPDDRFAFQVRTE